MALTKEQLQILEMLKEGKISVEESAKLLEAVNEPKPGNRPKATRVIVTITESGKDTTNLRIPVTLATVFWKFVPKDIQAQINLDLILEQIEAGATGEIIEIEQPAQQRKINISLA
ncbi:MAG: hypothetical protein WAP20_03150 [Limnochordia bacterium]|jgi:hypothetical protein|nr:hypothetical protein [Bacillota bacterium]HOB08968.1 hypothetical protein [Limnochordia bacterium]NLH30747.1 hypothetical protein [Bacillota bacterium]HPT92833.1 hypothetical protein [Limnochordia bacterium]HPZ31126.1 hypothetical protein [Limnochordia bacterium]